MNFVIFTTSKIVLSGIIPFFSNMIKINGFALFLTVFCVNNLVQAQSDLFSPPLSSRVASYDIDVQLDSKKKVITARELIHWQNPSKDTVYELQLHLYLNAFKNNKSTFISQRNTSRAGFGIDVTDDKIWGWQKITRFEDNDGNDLLADARYIQPDDDNEDDQTVFMVPLKKGVLPGEKVTYDLDFTAKLPNLIARTGYDKDYYFLVHWFPKLGVYEYPGMRYATEGQWNCHQFHSNTEFYADFGVYNVNITVPKSFNVAASGLLQKVEEKGEMATHSYRAEDVIDFGWTASPTLQAHHEKWKHVDIKVMANPEHTELVPRYMQAAKNCLEYLDTHVGKYPYPNLTIVCPPFHGLRSGGMEYPTFISSPGLKDLPDYVRIIEVLCVHELTHQYFMQMLATNEFEEAWMDEGFTTYWESRIMDHYYGEQSSNVEFMGYRYGGMEGHRIDYLSLDNPKIAENFRPGWEFKHGGYHTLAYAKTCTWLKTLEGLLGYENMNAMMRVYFEQWKFKHPCGTDFIKVVNDYVAEHLSEKFPEGMDWFFDQVLYSSEICDYSIRNIVNAPLQKNYGIYDEEVDRGESEKMYHSKVVLIRKGEVIMPQEVLIHFENGEEVLEYWDGKERSFEFAYKGKNKIEWAILDPEKKIYMDSNFNDNSYSVQPERSPLWKVISRFFFWVQNAMLSLGSLV